MATAQKEQNDRNRHGSEAERIYKELGSEVPQVHVQKDRIWRACDPDMKDFITTFVKKFNAKPIYITVGDKKW